MRVSFPLFLLTIAMFLGISNLEAQRRRGKGSVSGPTQLREAEYYFTEGEKYYILEDYVKALANFQKSIDLDPSNSAAYFKKAQIEFRGEEYALAERDAVKALEMDSGNKYYYLLLIDVYTQTSQFKEAIETYERMIEQVEGTEQYLYEVAALYQFSKDYNSVLKTFERLEDSFGYSEQLGLERQRIMRIQGKDNEAEAELLKLVEAFPDNELLALELVEFYRGRNEDRKAREVLENTLATFPGNSRVALSLGDIYVQEEQYREAMSPLVTAFKDSDLDANAKVQIIATYKVIERDDQLNQLLDSLCKVLVEVHPEEPNTFAVYGDYLLENGRADEAAVLYEKVLELDQSNFGVWQNLLLIYSQTENFEKVIDIADKAMIAYPNQSILYYLSGFAHLRQKKFREAISLLNMGSRLVSGDANKKADFNSLLGEAYNGAKDHRNSDKAYEAVLEVQPDNYIVLNNYSYYLASRGEELEKAEKMAARLVKENPNEINYLDTYAWVLYKRKKYKEAKKVAEKAVDSGKATAVHFEHYGDILFKLGDVDGAVEQWKRARGMDSSLHLIDKKIADRKLYEN